MGQVLFTGIPTFQQDFTIVSGARSPPGFPSVPGVTIGNALIRLVPRFTYLKISASSAGLTILLRGLIWIYVGT